MDSGGFSRLMRGIRKGSCLRVEASSPLDARVHGASVGGPYMGFLARCSLPVPFWPRREAPVMFPSVKGSDTPEPAHHLPWSRCPICEQWFVQDLLVLCVHERVHGQSFLRSYDAPEHQLRMRGEGMREVMECVRLRILIYTHQQFEKEELSVGCRTHGL